MKQYQHKTLKQSKEDKSAYRNRDNGWMRKLTTVSIYSLGVQDPVNL